MTRGAPTTLALLALAAACTHKADAPTSEASLYFRGEPVARIADVVDGKSVARTETLARLGQKGVTHADLDDSGFVVDADYKETSTNRRAVELRAGHLASGGVAVALAPPIAQARVVVVIDLLRYVQPRRATPITLVDLAGGEWIAGTVERRGAEVVALDAYGAVVARANVEGARTGPGAFFEGDSPPSLDTAPVEVPLVGDDVEKLRLVGIDDVLPALALDGPGQRHDGAVVIFDAGHDDAAPPAAADGAPGLFVESGDPAVVAFALAAAGGKPHEALSDAVAVAAAVHARVDAQKTAVPPSARNMLEAGGDCDGAAALSAAALRALGHQARVVVGYHRSGQRLVPHAWSEVWDGARWVPVDATVPKVGIDAEHLRLFPGLGGALTMGRVLGKLRVEPLP